MGCAITRERRGDHSRNSPSGRFENFVYSRSKRTFTVSVADAFTADQLAIRVGDPLGRLRRVLLNQAGEAVYFAIGLVRADRIALAWTTKRPG